MSSMLKASATTRTAPSPTPSNASGSGSKRKRPDEHSMVYSQPQDTGKGDHLRTRLSYTAFWLGNDMANRWVTAKEIIDYLNIFDAEEIKSFIATIKTNHPATRVIYSAKTDKFRYRSKLPIHNAAELKRHFQQQKSVQGLQVKDLKDGWPKVVEDLRALEASKEVLVKHQTKDKAPKTVWGNDPSLMYDMDPVFRHEWHKIQIPANPDDLRTSLKNAGLKPSSAARQATVTKQEKKRKKAPRRSGKQTNQHMANILKDFSHMRR